MSCPYYWWNNHYACRKSGKDVNDDIYYKYCRNYDYGDCPIYKGETTSGCYLTSACVEAKGMPDDCRELTVLRKFRDEYLKNRPEGDSAICEYYHTAPAIVEKIKQQNKASEIFESIYTDLVVPCVELIDANKNEEAFVKYRDYVKSLKEKFLKG